MQILNLTGYGINVHVDSGRLVVKDGNHYNKNPTEQRFRRRKIDFDKLIISGNSGNISLSAIKWITKQKRDIAILDWNGRLVTSISAPLANLGANRLAQYEAAKDSAKKAKIAKWIINQKIEGTLRVLEWLKTRRPHFSWNDKIQQCASNLDKISEFKNLLYTEAMVSQHYWKAIASVIEQRWEFLSRNSRDVVSSRDADDPVNALFNYGYSILESECWKAVNTVGLEPYVGFIHKTYTNKAPLIYDLQEPFRWIIEKSVLKILQEKTVKKSDFITTDEGNVRLKQTAIKVIVDEVARQFSTRVLDKGMKRQWGTMIMIKTRELVKLF